MFVLLAYKELKLFADNPFHMDSDFIFNTLFKTPLQGIVHPYVMSSKEYAFSKLPETISPYA